MKKPTSLDVHKSASAMTAERDATNRHVMGRGDPERSHARMRDAQHANTVEHKGAAQTRMSKRK
jgi:hypothetical protein